MSITWEKYFALAVSKVCINLLQGWKILKESKQGILMTTVEMI